MLEDELRSSIGAAIRCACRFDVLALKPGNVSIESSGHGMSARDFLRSAAVAAPALVVADVGLGRRILNAVTASVDVAQCNTNLGIVLLAAPLAEAALRSSEGGTLRARLASVLETLSLDDTAQVYAAIRYASPGGLGTAEEEDVAHEPRLKLKQAMQLAAIRDRIAYQYCSDFEDVFERGIPTLRIYRARWRSLAWAMVALYIELLKNYPDSHVARKFGETRARDLSRLVEPLESDFKACENPATFAVELQKLDRELKLAGVNPGTSADIAVASVLALQLQHA